MQIHIQEPISKTAARAIRGGRLPHLAPPASPVGSRVTLTLEAGEGTDPEIIFADPRREDSWRVAMSPAAEAGLWQAEILLPQEPTLLYYHFVLADGTLIRERRQKDGAEKLMLRPGLQDWLGIRRNRRLNLAPRHEVLITRPMYGAWKEQDFRIAVYQPEGAPPAWVRGQVFYQIFPDRFARSGETPFRQRAHQHEALRLGWDELPERPPKGRDFFGGNLRGVIDHLDHLTKLGVTALYFTPIFNAPSNHRYDAIDYHQIDPLLGTDADLKELVEQAKARGLRVLLDGVFNHCSDESIYFKAAQADKTSPYYRWFHFERWPDHYSGWAGVETMPEFVECPEVEDFFFGPQGVAQHWLSYGTSGWRTDVTPWLSDEYWQRFRRAVRRAYPEAYLVAEDWGDATRRLLGDSFDATMNYRFANSLVGFAGGRLNPLELDDRLETLRRDTPPDHFHAQMNLLNSHDTARALTRLKGSAQRLMLAAAMQLAYPGAPMIYSGDEAGQEGAYAEDSRRPYPWGQANPELLDFYQRAIHARRASRALSYGDVQTAWADPQGSYAFLRQDGDEVVLAVFNNRRKSLKVEIPLPGAPDGSWRDLLGRLPTAQVKDGVLSARIPSLCAAWFAPVV